MLEVQSIEQVGTCYQVKCCDLFHHLGNPHSVISCTFHSDCKPILQKKIRRGKVIQVKNAGVFCVGMQSSESCLVVMASCIQ